MSGLATAADNERSSVVQTDAIHALEDQLRRMPQAEVPVEHAFAPNLYVRTIRLKAGTLLTGKIHATEHIFVLSEGEMLLACNGESQRVKAPYQAVCKPGTKRAGYAITDAVCANVHITKETDLAALERELIESEALTHQPEEIPWLG